VPIEDADPPGLLVKSGVARQQLNSEVTLSPGVGTPVSPPVGKGGPDTPEAVPTVDTEPKRFHGSVALDSTRVGRDAGKIADEAIAHLVGLVGADATVTLEMEASMPSGAPENVVRTVTENSQTLKFTSQGFDAE
jgi:hypothetical protein